MRFGKRRRYGKSKADWAAIEFNREVLRLPHPYNYGCVSGQFVTHAFPDAELFKKQKLHLTPLCGPEDIRRLVHRYRDGGIGVDELTSAVFGLSYAELAGAAFEAERLSRCAATDETLNALRRSEISTSWTRALDEAMPTEFIFECLGDGSCRLATSSGLGSFVQDPWESRESHALIYADAARIGFVAVAQHFGKTNSNFGWTTSYRVRRELAGDVLRRNPLVPHPLEVLPEKQLAAIRARSNELAHRLDRMFGKPEGEARLPHTFAAASHQASLWESAEMGAMLAAVGIDPAACIMYSAAGTRIAPAEFTWFQPSSDSA